MSATTAVRRAAALSVAAAAMAVVAVVGPPAAAASPNGTLSCGVGMVPLTNQNTWMRAEPGFTFVLYTLPAGAGFRITAGPAAADGLIWWFGHGNNTGNGWVPEQNLTCA
jgi:hypothetical protein